MITDIKKILTELSYRVKDGSPDFENEQHLIKLYDVLKECQWPIDARVELLRTLTNVPIEKSAPKIDLKEVIKQVSELGEILYEASVFQTKYPAGSRFMLGADGLDKMKKHSGQSIPDGVWLKHKEVDDAIEVMHKEDGRDEFWIKSEKNGKVYHVKGSGSVIGKWFKKATKNPGDIKFNTGTLEACALLGLKMDALGWLTKFNSSTEKNISKITQQFVSEVLSTLGSGDFASNDLSKMKSAPLPQIIMVAAIASGMNKFRNDKGVAGWNFIHGKIDTYYKAEQSNPYIVTQGGKANTADAIVLKGSVGSFLTNMTTQNVTFDSSGLCKLDTGEEFYQVSLKKAEGGAQLGKITTDFVNKFGLISNEDILSMVIHENIEKDILDEGLKDLFMKGKEFIKTTGKKVLDGIKKASQKVQAYWGGIVSSFKGATSKANKSGDDLIINLASTIQETKVFTIPDDLYWSGGSTEKLLIESGEKYFWPKTKLPFIEGIGYDSSMVAEDTIKILETHPTKVEIIETLMYRAKHHKEQTAGMIAAFKIFEEWLSEVKKPKKKKLGVLESVQSIADAYNNNNKVPLNKLVKLDNQLLTKVISLTKSVGMAYVGGVSKLSIPSKVDTGVVIKFLSNYKALTAFQTVASNSKGRAKNASQIYDDFVDLEKQMFFGKTSLPLFKVYGLSSSGAGEAYKFLKTGKEFAAERKSEFESNKDKVSTVFIVYVKAKSGYGTMSAWIFSHFKGGNAMFNNVTFRTNSSGTVSFVIEGSKSQSWPWILSQKWGAGLA